MDSYYKRVLVTGGAGFIGSNYVRHALDRHPDWEITVLDKLTYAGNLDNLAGVKERINFVQGDVTDPEQVHKAMVGAHAVLNFAAESHVDRSLMDSWPFVRTNVDGVLVLLEAARKLGVKRFLHVSTDEVYGDLSGTDRHSLETDMLAPRSPYSATKAGAEHLVLAFGTSFGLDVLVTRGSNTYGPYQYPEKIIPLFITNAMRGKPMPVYGNGRAVRDYMHVEDHCSGIDVVLHEGKAGEAYNLGAREQISGLEVAGRLLRLLGKSEDLINFVTDRPGHDYRYSIDPGKTEALGWRRRWDFASGLQSTVAWYTTHQDWWERVKERLDFRELDRRLYHNRGGNERVTG